MRKNGNINFVLVGARGTGKSVYLTSLFLYGKQTTSKDRETMKYLQPLGDRLLEGKFPEATAGTLYELMFNYKDNEFVAQVQIDDLDGYLIETLHQEPQKSESERIQLIDNIRSAEGILFFFPYDNRMLNETAMKNFMYEIDTVISELRSVYPDREKIPVPAVISLSQWDKSDAYHQSNEQQKVMEYIDNSKFLKLAQEKIDTNFLSSIIFPISSTGKDIHAIKPYNIEAPIKYFLKKTYAIWEKKIEALQTNREELLLFLSQIYTDIELYREGKYRKLYHTLESEYAQQLLTELKQLKTLEEYQGFQQSNQEMINALTTQHQQEISAYGAALKNKNNKNRLLTFAASIALMVIGVGWYLNSKTVKSEEELFKSISTHYHSQNFIEVLEDIETYQEVYASSSKALHKNEIAIMHNDIEKSQLIAKATRVVEDKGFDDEDEIESLLDTMDKLGIQERDLRASLITKKQEISSTTGFKRFQEDIENSQLQDALNQVESEWELDFTARQKKTIQTILNQKVNAEIEKLLKEMPKTLNGINNYHDIEKKLQEVERLQKLKLQNYTPTILPPHKKAINEKKKNFKAYAQVLKEGAKVATISFVAQKDNSLGFKCGGDDEIILKIGSMEYHYDNQKGCNEYTISWENENTFKDGEYQLIIEEKDSLSSNEKVQSSIMITKDDLINMKSGSVEKTFEKGYSLQFKGSV